MRNIIGTLDSVGSRSCDRGVLIVRRAMTVAPTFVVPAFEAVTP